MKQLLASQDLKITGRKIFISHTFGLPFGIYLINWNYLVLNKFTKRTDFSYAYAQFLKSLCWALARVKRQGRGRRLSQRRSSWAATCSASCAVTAGLSEENTRPCSCRDVVQPAASWQVWYCGSGQHLNSHTLWTHSTADMSSVSLLHRTWAALYDTVSQVTLRSRFMDNNQLRIQRKHSKRAMDFQAAWEFQFEI